MRGPIARYGIAACLVAAAALLSVALSGFTGGHTFALFYVAVMVGTLLSGPGPGLLTVVLSAGIVYYLPPGRPDELIHAVPFTILATVISLVLTAILTAKRRAEEAEDTSRRSEVYYRSLVQNASDMIVLVDHAGNILYESNSVEWLLGYKPDERVGKNLLDLILPEDAGLVSEPFAGNGLEEPLEFRVLAKDGSVRHLEAVGRDMMDDPMVGAVVVDVRDITERKRTEARLRETETRFRVLLQNFSDVIALCEPDNTIRYISPAVRQILGYERGEISAGSGPGERVGLAGMRERAGMLGGTFEIESSGDGTTVKATIPYDS